MNNIKTFNKNKNNFTLDISEDEIILNEDDFGTIGDLPRVNEQEKNNNKNHKIILELKNNKEISQNENQINKSKIKDTQKPIVDLKFLSENPSIIRKYEIKDENTTDYQVKKLLTNLIPNKDKNLATNDENINLDKNNSDHVIQNLKSSVIKTNKTVFSKISENLYDNNILNSNNKNDIFGIYNQENDYYDKLTADNFIISYLTKANSENQKAIERFIKRNDKYKIDSKNKILDLKNFNFPEKFDEENNHDHLNNFTRKVNSEKKLLQKNKSPDDFLLNQKKFEIKKKLCLENLKLKQNNLSKANIKDKPTINKYSKKILTKRTYNDLKGNKEKNIHLKLYEDFVAREKNMEKLQCKSYSLIKTLGNKKISPDVIKKATNRLYKDYIHKEQKIEDNNKVNIIYYRNLSSMPFTNKKSDSIISSKFINKYKLMLSSCFNKTVNEVFDINFNEFICFMNEIGMIDFSFNEENKKEIERKNIKKNPNINEFKAISEIWKEHNDLKINNNFQNCEDVNKKEINNNNNNHNNSFNLKEKKNWNYKRKSDGCYNYNNIKNETQKLIKESWKIITNNKIFNKELYANSHKMLLFCLSILGIYQGSINNDIKIEFPFLLSSEIQIDVNLCKNIYKNFTTFRKYCISNLITKKQLRVNSLNNTKKITKYVIKRKKIKNQPKEISVSLNEKNNQIQIEENKLKNINKNNIIKENTFNIKNSQKINKNDDNKITNTEIFNNNCSGENDIYEIEKIFKNNRSINMEEVNNNGINNNSQKIITNMKLLNNSNSSDGKKTTSEGVNTFCSSSKKKTFKFVFQVKIDEEYKKLIINENQNIKEKIDEFCLKYELDEYEKGQIIEAVNRKFLQKNVKNKY